MRYCLKLNAKPVEITKHNQFTVKFAGRTWLVNADGSVEGEFAL